MTPTGVLNRPIENCEAMEPGCTARLFEYLAVTGRLYASGLRYLSRSMHNPLSIVPGGGLLAVTGVPMARRSGCPSLTTPWLFNGIAALALSALSWLVLLLPDQRQMERTTDPVVIRRTFVRWSVVGWRSTPLLF